MLVGSIEQRISTLNETKKRLEEEVSNLFKKKDKILSEIKDQRYGKTEVLNKKMNEQSMLDHLTSLTSSLRDQLAGDKFNYENTKNNQINIINEFNNEIKRLSEEYKNLILFEGELEKLNNNLKVTKETINIKRSELLDLTYNIDSKQKDFNKQRLKIEKKEKELIELELNNQIFSSNLSKRENELNRKEKRLNNLKKELFSKK